MTFHGVIYGYRDPDTGIIRYVGQAWNLAKRHKRHLKENLTVDKWLRSFANPPQPEILCEVMGEDRRTFLDDMAEHETVAMFHHHTYVISYPNEGGLNKTIPMSTDYQNLGRIGGRVSGNKNAKSGRWKKIKTYESCAKGGRVTGLQKVRDGHMLAMSYKGGKIQGQKNAVSGQIQSLGKTSTGCHTRWHTLRGMVNPRCPLCIAAQQKRGSFQSQA